MGVALKDWRVEGRHFHHTFVMWVRVLPEMAFAYMADITRHDEWKVNEIKVAPRTPGPLRLGSKYAAVGRQGGKDWPSELEVTAFEPPRRFEFTAPGGPIGTPEGDPYRHEFLFTPQKGGTQIEALRTDPLPPDWPSWLLKPLAFLIMRFQFKRGRAKTLESLQARLDELVDTPSQ